MLLLNVVGIIAYRTKVVDKNGGRQFSNFVLEIVTPVLVVNAYADVEYESRLVVNMLWTFLLAAAAYGIFIAAVYLLIRPKPGRETEIERFSAIYSNCGFMGIPLASAILGNEGVFYTTAFLSVFFCFAWTHGIMLLTGQHDRKALLKKLCSPTMIGIVIGLLLFFFRIPLPDLLEKTFGYVASMNTPMAMVASGISVAQADLFHALKNPRVYYVSAVKLLIVPLLWELVHDAVQRRRVSIRQVVGLLLVPLGFAAYCCINRRVSGNPFQFLIYQREHWNQRTGLFFSTAAYQTDYLLRCLRSGNWRDALGLWLPNLIACFSALILLSKTAPRLRASQTAWFLAYYIIAVGATWLLSAPRYLLVLLPVPLALAQCTRKRTANLVLTALSALAALGYLAAFALRWQVW